VNGHGEDVLSGGYSTPGPHEVICHNDFAPYNLVFGGPRHRPITPLVDTAVSVGLVTAGTRESVPSPLPSNVVESCFSAEHPCG
jgi:hypothetical protein